MISWGTDDVEAKARARWRRDCAQGGGIYTEPSAVDVDADAQTVEISNVSGTLARYTFTRTSKGGLRFRDADADAEAEEERKTAAYHAEMDALAATGVLPITGRPANVTALRRALAVYGLAVLPTMAVGGMMLAARTAIRASLDHADACNKRAVGFAVVMWRCFVCWETSTSQTTFCPFCAAPHDLDDVARDVHRDHFDSRRGVIAEPGDPLVIWYDNDPTADRPAQHAAVLAMLETKGIAPMARAGYSAEGSDADPYTLVHAFKNAPGVADAVTDAVAQSLAVRGAVAS